MNHGVSVDASSSKSATRKQHIRPDQSPVWIASSAALPICTMSIDRLPMRRATSSPALRPHPSRGIRASQQARRD